ncbi:MAG: hypothetical protein ABI131_04820 [Nostocoides sp.]
MSFWTTHPKARWIAPVAMVAAVAVTPYARSASADSGLAPRSAAQLLADVQQADVATMSGTIVESADLGLPSIPGIGASNGSAEMSSLVSGSHTLRIWADGPDKQRLAVVGTTGESDIIRNGTTLWTWSSATKTATRRTLPADGVNQPPASALPSTPQDAAAQALKAIDPSTTVTTSGTARVAGRTAYELVLTPKTKNTRVAQVRIAMDGVKHVPLRVQVYSTRLSKPAFEVGFAAIDFGRPDARQFAFTPAPGTTVTNGDEPKVPTATGTAPSTATAMAKPTIVGTGWATVVVAKLPADALSSLSGGATSGGQSTAQLDKMLRLLPKVSGTWGSGRLLSGTLFSVVLGDDGRIAIGAVAPDQLYAALGAT